MPRQDFGALQRAPVPYLDGVVSEARDDLLVIVLQAVDAFAVLRAAVDALEDVTAAAPVALYALDVADDFGVEAPVEYVRSVVLAWFGFEEVLYPGKERFQFDVWIMNELFEFDKIVFSYNFNVNSSIIVTQCGEMCSLHTNSGEIGVTMSKQSWGIRASL